MTTAASRRRPRPTFARRVIFWALAVVLGFYAACALGFMYLRWLPPLTTAVQVQRRIESLFARGHYTKHFTFKPLRSISRDLQHAVIAAEDSRFYQHSGLDWTEMRKAVEEDRGDGRLRGASTITQQLVKNLFLTTRRSVLRKALEYPLAPLAELILGKNRILELYLNVVEWGPGLYGAEAASQYYYRVPASRIGREQAARLAAVLPAPRTRKPERMHEYSSEILARMRRMGW